MDLHEVDEMPSNRRLYTMIGRMLVVLAAALAITMLPVDVAPEPPFEAGGSVRYGYTISLVLFALPVAGMVVWFLMRRDRTKHHWEAFRATLLVIVVLWSALDVFLANTLFVFPDPEATLGIEVFSYHPELGWRPHVPIEEFLFYMSGSAFLVLAYIWASEVWYPTATRGSDEYQLQAPRLVGDRQFHLPTVVIATLCWWSVSCTRSSARTPTTKGSRPTCCSW
jgi:hypothetical protein